MRRHARLACALTLALATTGPLGAAPKVTDYPVTVTIADSRNGYFLHVGSDTQGAYVTTSLITSNIHSFGTGSDWSLTTYQLAPGKNGYRPSNRTVLFDLTEPVSPISGCVRRIVGPHGVTPWRASRARSWRHCRGCLLRTGSSAAVKF